jgi:hypothetical protein
MMKRFFFLAVCAVALLSACNQPQWGRLPAAPLQIPPTPAFTPSTEATRLGTSGAVTLTSKPAISVSGPLTPTPTLDPQAWKTLPVVPQVSGRMLEVYQAGLVAGHDPSRFSKIGDCQNITTYFLADFDHPGEYRLGSKYASLQPTIDHFSGSWSRESLAVKGGMGVASVLDPYSFFKDLKSCGKAESPLACEIRVYNPSFALISMETWYGNKPVAGYEKYLRQIVEYTLSQNVVPILATKADNLEGNYGVNEAIARVAYDYQVPLWNFWAATYPLPSHGLTEDLFHLTQARSFFDDPARMEAAWPWRNLTALQAIDAVYRAVSLRP